MDISLLLQVVIWLQVGGCIWFFYGPHRQYWIDEARYNLFVIRDGLFDAAALGEIPFDHPAYSITRTTLNGMIRNIEDDSLLRSIPIVIWLQRSAGGKQMMAEYRQQHEDSMAGITEDASELLDKVRLEAVIAVLAYIAHTSLPLWLIFTLLDMVRHSKRLLNQLANGLGEVVRFEGHQAMAKQTAQA